jgi:hypothetical protein
MPRLPALQEDATDRAALADVELVVAELSHIVASIDPVPVAPPGAVGVRAEVRAKKPATSAATSWRWAGL